MAEVIPIQGIRYNYSKVKINEVVTPPYDVISPQEQEKFYERNPYNVIRLELGKEFPQDAEDNSRYTRAASHFQKWLHQDVLIREKNPSIYLYRQGFDVDNKTYYRTGVICGIGLAEYKQEVVIPHEETLPKAKIDRLNLMRACRANFSPIFGIYADPKKSLDNLFADEIKNPPDISFNDDLGHSHEIWVVSSNNVIQQWQDLLIDKKIYIADGHHRYETALEFMREMRSLGHDGYNHVMVTLVNMYDSGLVVFPTHRLVRNVNEFNADRLYRELATRYSLETIASTDLNTAEGASRILSRLEQEKETHHRFCVYTGGKDIVFVSIPRAQEKFDPEKSAAWNSLDVTVLQELILNRILGIGEAERAQGNYIKYTRDEEEALRLVRDGEYQAAFLVNPTSVDEVIAVAGAGEKMPQKSTFFYPKLITGLVMNPLE